ncbi:branched-chain amino acid ABC transporter permease [Halorientalis sp.]|uniref:branched-chain amino acid ABC transporter permease n=1 Tax=Halorientalis sp. TaxID=1931229 RepID=UPI002637B0CE|nr:branched-chain amino acid ABC transporter permease [Halorientalis sp.]
MVNPATILVTGAMVGSLYVLIAIGFSLIYGVRGVINLAHGAFIMLGAFAYLVAGGQVSGVAAFVIAILFVGLFAVGLYLGLVRYIEHNVVITFLATVVVALIIQQLLTLEYSLAPRSLEPIVSGGIAFAGTRVRYYQLIAFALSWVALGLLFLFVRRTTLGRNILATSMTEKGAKLAGTNVLYVNVATWFVAGAFAGFAGVFIGTLQSTSPTMWINPLGLAFIIVTIGGVGSIKGSIIAAYLIGFLETMTVTFVGPAWRGMFALLLLVVIILAKPEGLFGREFIE